MEKRRRIYIYGRDGTGQKPSRAGGWGSPDCAGGRGGPERTGGRTPGGAGGDSGRGPQEKKKIQKMAEEAGKGRSGGDSGGGGGCRQQRPDFLCGIPVLAEPDEPAGPVPPGAAAGSAAGAESNPGELPPRPDGGASGGADPGTGVPAKCRRSGSGDELPAR